VKIASFRVAALATALAGLSSASAFAAQPIFVGPYGPVTQILYDVDYAVSAAQSPVQNIKADTIISIGLPSGTQPAGCFAQVDWFDWNGAPAGLSGGPAATPALLLPNHTLEFTTSSNALPNNYPNFQENVFRDMTGPFEGYAQIRIQCPAGGPTLKALRIDAEFATFDPTTQSYMTKTINVTKPTGLVGY